MKRNINSLKDQHFDILIIGGGISGSAIAWDAITRRYKVALIEKNDYGHATSMATSKLIHGGMRYLAQLDFKVVRESLKERRFFEQNIPHQIFPMPFLFPIYTHTPTPKFIMNIGLTLYDILSYDKNKLTDKSKHLKNHKWVSKQEALKFEPNLNPVNLKGAFIFYDTMNVHPERTNVDFAMSAIDAGAKMLNHLSFQEFILEKNESQSQKKMPSPKKKRVVGIIAKDELTNKKFNIFAKTIVNASGPWGDKILSKVLPQEYTLVRSKGIHIIVPKIHGEFAVSFETKNKKHFFMLPWRGKTLIGTTDTEFKDEPDNLTVTQQDKEEFIQLINENFPVNLTTNDIVHSYAGIRPLVEESEVSSTYKTSRKHEIIDHGKTDKVYGLISVFGGKYTTSRSLAEETVKLIAKRYKLPKAKSQTIQIPLRAGEVTNNFEDFIYSAKKEAKSLGKSADGLIEHLIEFYGKNYQKVLFYVEQDKKLLKLIDKNFKHILAEIYYAVNDEQAQTVSDFLLRRAGLGNEGLLNKKSVQLVAETMAKLLNWNKSKIQKEINDYLKNY